MSGKKAKPRYKRPITDRQYIIIYIKNIRIYTRHAIDCKFEGRKAYLMAFDGYIKTHALAAFKGLHRMGKPKLAERFRKYL
jgi:hypothetical protein